MNIQQLLFRKDVINIQEPLYIQIQEPSFMEDEWRIAQHLHWKRQQHDPKYNGNFLREKFHRKGRLPYHKYNLPTVSGRLFQKAAKEAGLI